MPILFSKAGALGDQHCECFEKVALLRHVHGYRRDSSRGERSAFAVLSNTIPGCESSCGLGETPPVLREQVEEPAEEVRSSVVASFMKIAQIAEIVSESSVTVFSSPDKKPLLARLLEKGANFSNVADIGSIINSMNMKSFDAASVPS